MVIVNLAGVNTRLLRTRAFQIWQEAACAKGMTHGLANTPSFALMALS